MEQAGIAPETVITPCSEIVDNPASSTKERADAFFVRGKAYYDTRRPDLAGRDFDAAIVLTPTNAELFASRASVASWLGQTQEEVVFLQKALALDPANARALRTVAGLLMDAGDHEGAERYFTMALDSDPNDVRARMYRSKNRVELRRFDDALEDADILVRMSPADINHQTFLNGYGDRIDVHGDALTHRADVYEARGEFERAEQDLGAAIEYDRSIRSLGTRGRYLAYKRGREKEAAADLDDAISLGSDDPRDFYARGIVFVTLHQFDQAFAAFDHAIELHPGFASALRMRARMYREKNKTELAVADMRNAIADDAEILQQTMPALRTAGYWRSNETPTEMTPTLEDAIRACMLDKHCN